MKHHRLITRRSGFGAAESRFDRCAWLRIPSTCTAAVLLPGCEPFPRSSNETASSGGPIPRLFWSHPYQSPRLRRSSSPMVPFPIRQPDCGDPGLFKSLPLARPVSDARLRS